MAEETDLIASAGRGGYRGLAACIIWGWICLIQSQEDSRSKRSVDAAWEIRVNAEGRFA